jgi:hypothetical protein
MQSHLESNLPGKGSEKLRRQMIVESFEELRRLAKARIQPSLPLDELLWLDTLNSIKTEFFPELTSSISFYFIRRGPLACIWVEKAVIYIHEVLNDSDIPKDVISLIFKHELLHMVVRPRMVDGVQKIHPPEFFENEGLIAPERQQAWDWIWVNLGFCLKPNKKKEGIYVRPNWKERHLTISELILRFREKEGLIPCYKGW